MTWNQLIAYVVKLLKMEQKVEKNSADIEALQKQVDALTDNLQSQVAKTDRNQENAERDRRELLLQLKVVLLQHGLTAKPELSPDDRERAETRNELAALREQIAALQKQLEAKQTETDVKE